MVVAIHYGEDPNGYNQYYGSTFPGTLMSPAYPNNPVNFMNHHQQQHNPNHWDNIPQQAQIGHEYSANPYSYNNNPSQLSQPGLLSSSNSLRPRHSQLPTSSSAYSYDPNLNYSLPTNMGYPQQQHQIQQVMSSSPGLRQVSTSYMSGPAVVLIDPSAKKKWFSMKRSTLIFIAFVALIFLSAATTLFVFQEQLNELRVTKFYPEAQPRIADMPTNEPPIIPVIPVRPIEKQASEPLQETVSDPSSLAASSEKRNKVRVVMSVDDDEEAVVEDYY